MAREGGGCHGNSGRPAGDDTLGSQLGQGCGHGPAQARPSSGDEGHLVAEASSRQHAALIWLEEARLRRRMAALMKSAGAVEA